MPCNYVFIDYENVQPDDLDQLLDQPVRVYTFVGKHQTKLSFEFLNTMQRMGDRAGYIRMSENGPNALDFHIAYYVGELAASDPEAYFHIISRDSGFDPLIRHLRSREKSPLRVYRAEQIVDLAFLRPKTNGVFAERLSQLTENLIKRGKQLPRKRSSLESLIRDHFKNQRLDSQVGDLIAALQRQKLLTVSDKTVSYNLPPADSTPPLPKAHSETSVPG